MKHQDYLNSFTNFESHLQHVSPQSFNLERVHQLLHALGDPQKNLRFVHVAGTKGKGSTCCLTAYILRAAGYRVGLYTSPHLYNINERLRILKPNAPSSELKKDFYGAITNREFNALIIKYRRSIDKARGNLRSGGLTYFEVLTALALCHFNRQKVDIVVLETGLGGRLDATNAVDTIVDGLTPVSLDHTALLGKTLRKIAIEKAAIIKDLNSRVVVGYQSPDVMSVIKDRCRNFEIKPLLMGRDINFQWIKGSIKGQTFDVQTPENKYKNLEIKLSGEHQLHNAAMAIGMVESLEDFGFVIKARSVRLGLKEARWPARLEVISRKPFVVVDCAHNIASAEVLTRSIKKEFQNKKIILILGVSADKDIKGISLTLGRMADGIILTESKHARAHRFSEKEIAMCFKNKNITVTGNVSDALDVAVEMSSNDDLILVTGSIFIAAEARGVIKNVSA